MTPGDLAAAASKFVVRAGGRGWWLYVPLVHHWYWRATFGEVVALMDGWRTGPWRHRPPRRTLLPPNPPHRELPHADHRADA